MGVHFDFNYTHFRNRINGIGAVESSMMETFNRRVFTAIQKTAEGAREKNEFQGKKSPEKKVISLYLQMKTRIAKQIGTHGSEKVYCGKMYLFINVLHVKRFVESTETAGNVGVFFSSRFFLLGQNSLSLIRSRIFTPRP